MWLFNISQQIRRQAKPQRQKRLDCPEMQKTRQLGELSGFFK
ncbi:hypothetical protein VCR15J2_290026 [Vibrio coralliirubri]|nr:hypothetical protein VCR15J2_290026 [Vibrio coralliirubri]